MGLGIDIANARLGKLGITTVQRDLGIEQVQSQWLVAGQAATLYAVKGDRSAFQITVVATRLSGTQAKMRGIVAAAAIGEIDECNS